MIIFVNILTVLVLFFLILTVIGLINPRIVFKKNRFSVLSRFGFSAVILFIVLSLLVHFLEIL